MTVEDIKLAPKVDYDFFLSLVLKRNILAIKEILFNDNFDINKEDFRGATALHYVAELDDIELLKILLNQPKIKINVKTLEMMSTPLMIAAGHGSLNCLRYLLAFGADPSIQNAAGYTALMIAIESNNFECVEVILAQESDKLNIKAQNQNGLNALMFATSNPEITNRLIQISDLAQTDSSGYSALHLACLKEKGSSEVVEILIEAGIYIDSRSKNNETPLHCAFRGGNIKIANFLIEKGANLIAKDSCGYSAFAFAAMFIESDDESKEFFIKHKIPNPEIRITLKAAAEKGRLSIIKFLLNELKFTEKEHNYFYLDDAILESATQGHLNCLKYLLLKNNFRDFKILFEASVLALQFSHFSCFEYLYQCFLNEKSEVKQDLSCNFLLYEDMIIKEAFNSGCTEACELFLNRGQDFNGSDPVTYIMAASGNGYIEIVKLLISFGADINCVHDIFGSALLLATTSGHSEIVQILLENGADPSISDNNGYTPLISAAFYGHEEIFKCLLGIDGLTDAKAFDGTTPFLAAASSGSVKILEILIGDNDENIYEVDNLGNNCMHLAAEQSIHIKALIYLLNNVKDIKMLTEQKNNLGVTALDIVIAQQNHLSLFSLIAAQPIINEFLNSPAKQEFHNFFDCKNQEMCLICRDEFLISDIGTKLPCGHLFHEACYDEWAIMKPFCPYCKSFPFKIKKRNN